MKPEEIFTENDFDFFEDLFELECIRAVDKTSSHIQYGKILQEIKKRQDIPVSGGGYVQLGKIYDADHFDKKFKRFKNSILKANYFSGDITFTLEFEV